MRLTSVDVRDVRNLAHVTLRPASGFNLFYGDNGAGKTSLLESISILSTGKSFRAGKISTIIRGEANHLTVSADIENFDTGVNQRIGIQRGRSETLVRIDGESINRISALAMALPCVIVSTSNHELVEGGPAERRSFLDWLLFHVEPEALKLFRRYRHALQQRNAALKQRASDALVTMWHPDLIEAGEAIDAARRRVLDDFSTKMQFVLAEWSDALKPSFTYRSGWPDGMSLEAGLSRLDQCRRRGITSVGPHRADIAVRSGAQEARYVLSRGQQKLLAAQMKMVQIDLYVEHHHHAPVVLFDDLPSELDEAARMSVFRYLHEKQAQVFFTSVNDVSKDLHCVSGLFHVKQGQIQKVVY